MDFDLAVIGSGPGGYKAAVTAARLGARVALVEKGLPGGNCLNYGCIPKKTLVHLASLIESVGKLRGRGLRGRVAGDFKAAMAHKDAVVTGMREDFFLWLKRLGVALLKGKARLEKPGRIRISAEESSHAPEEITCRQIIIASGSEPETLAGLPADGRLVLDSRGFMEHLDQLPDSVLIVGGGAVGVELAYVLHQFGARVAIAERQERLLCHPRIPERAAAVLERKLKRIGIEVLTEAPVEGGHIDGRQVEVVFSDGSHRSFSRVIVAVGRRPAARGLGLEAAGVELDSVGFVKISEYLETSVPGIYAIGDVKRGPMTANAALHDAKIAATNAILGNRLKVNYFKVPMVIHSGLEIATVGLTEEQAEEAGFEPEVARFNFAGSGKARAYHEVEGYIEVVHDAETGQLLGGSIVGPEAGEQIQMMTAACQSTRGLWFFKDMSYSHPSWCEELETAVDPYATELAKGNRNVFRPGILADRDSIFSP